MKRCFFHLLLFFYCQGIQAQLLIPFLGQNGKYGFADEQGQVIHAPVFDDVVEPFAENTIAVDCHKNREPVRLFRSGLVVPNPRLQMGRVLTVLNVGFNNILIDSFDHLVAMRVGTTFRIIDLRAEGKTVETFQEDYLNLPRWAKTPGFSLSNGSDFRFQHGLLKVFRSDGRVNFVDKNLREILSKDVAAGFVADEQHLVVAESDGRFGVVDRSGKVLIAPVFKNLEPSGLAGLFIGNKSQGSVIENKACGLVRTDGAIVLDTVYSDIEKVDGAELLLVRKGRKTGLYDLKGHLIEPIEAEYIYNQNFGFLISKWPNGEGMNLINRHGKRLFAQNAAEITPIKLANSLFFKVKSQGWTTILDTAMMVLARDSVENLDLIDTNPFLFMVRKNVSQSRLVSIQDAAGKIIVENKFDGLWSPQGWPDGLRFTYLNNLKGISDRHFNQILPPIFEEIALEEGRLDTFIWAKKKGEALYVPYDKKGKRRSDIDNAPAPRQESAQRVIGKMQSIPGGGNMATMFDGAQIRWPDSLDGQRPWATFRSSSAGALVIGFDPKTITAVLDHRFRNLLPPGFGVPENSADEQVLERFQQFGLLVIKKLPEVKPIAQPTPKPSPKPAEPIKNEPESVIADTPPPELVFSEEFSPSSRSSINTPATGAACGVIDWQGKWILEPKIGVEFLVLSPFLIAEFPAGARSSSHTLYEKGLRLHRVQQDEKGYLETNWLGRDRFSVHEGNTMRIG
ncbi:MAG: WG repeat-containing protein, partial [Saprospiraceae bacterium]|nr:WG repeat-containing protein [Saprospiraceae bacterium]